MAPSKPKKFQFFSIFFWKFKKWKNLKFSSLHSKIRAKFIQDTQCIVTEPKVRKLCLKDSTFEAIICHLLFQNLEILITSKILNSQFSKKVKNWKISCFPSFWYQKSWKIQKFDAKKYFFWKSHFFFNFLKISLK